MLKSNVEMYLQMTKNMKKYPACKELRLIFSFFFTAWRSQMHTDLYIINKRFQSTKQRFRSPKQTRIVQRSPNVERNIIQLLTNEALDMM